MGSFLYSMVRKLNDGLDQIFDPFTNLLTRLLAYVLTILLILLAYTSMVAVANDSNRDAPESIFFGTGLGAVAGMALWLFCSLDHFKHFGYKVALGALIGTAFAVLFFVNG